jgi:hypothetical protein
MGLAVNFISATGEALSSTGRSVLSLEVSA